MKIIIAPNAFKNSLSASDAAYAIEEGLLQAGFDGIIIRQPVGDGGDGTGALLRHYLQAETLWLEVNDPLGRKVKAPLGWIPDKKTAIIELADASGLRLLQPDKYNPVMATTAGCGQLIQSALTRNASEILLCIGGSATVDGGAGILRELGVLFKDADGGTLQQLPADLCRLQSIDISQLSQQLQRTSITIICDVKNMLLGESGAAAVFGPQKGAGAAEVTFLEKALSRFAEVAYHTTGIDIRHIEGGGAAGGVAAGLSAFCKVKITDGISYFLQKIEFEKLLDDADCVVTGEGAIDRQTLEGKAPYGVAKSAKQKGITVVGVAGTVPDTKDRELEQYFDWIFSINKKQVTLEEAIRQTRFNLIEAGKDIARYLENCT